MFLQVAMVHLCCLPSCVAYLFCSKHALLRDNHGPSALLTFQCLFESMLCLETIMVHLLCVPFTASIGGCCAVLRDNHGSLVLLSFQCLTGSMLCSGTMLR